MEPIPQMSNPPSPAVASNLPPSSAVASNLPPSPEVTSDLEWQKRTRAKLAALRHTMKSGDRGPLMHFSGSGCATPDKDFIPFVLDRFKRKESISITADKEAEGAATVCEEMRRCSLSREVAARLAK